MNKPLYEHYKFKKRDFDIDCLQALTDRERQVLEVYGSIKTKDKKEATAQILGIASHTVRAHLHSIFGKLNVTNHLDMIIVAEAIGEIELGVIHDAV